MSTNIPRKNESDTVSLMMQVDQSCIRNFAIISHVDHGKSTLADRFIELCGAMNQRKSSEQVLDSMDLERERGITIKSQTVCLPFRPAESAHNYLLNLIDTPGHVDFSFEVARSLLGCEGAILVVDATQGVQAQTLANCYVAVDHGLEIVPVLNKIDMPNARPDAVCQEIEDMVGVDATGALLISARTGQGVSELLSVIVNQLPAPAGSQTKKPRALIMDSMFDNYQGVIILIRIMDGILRTGMQIRFMETGAVRRIEKLWVMTPEVCYVDELRCGQVGYLAASIREISSVVVCDTITDAQEQDIVPITEIRTPKPQVYAGIYPVDSDDYDQLRDGLSKLVLNDSALAYSPESSAAMGFGFRCGFLGTLHMEIVKERLEREYRLNLLITAPSVIYEFHLKSGEVERFSSTQNTPSAQRLEAIFEPMVKARIIVPSTYVGKIIELCVRKRGKQLDMQYHSERVILLFLLPLAEVILNFHDRLKSASKGFASVDYETVGYEKSDIVKVDILINHERCDPLSVLTHRSQSQKMGRELAQRIKELIPRQMFEVAIQAAIGAKIIARESIKALRRNVTAKCYGGDITRKRKLLEKQKKGKSRMKQFGKIEIPQEAFLAVLGLKED